MTKPETKRLWAKNNPDKIAAQLERRRAKAAAMTDEEKEAARIKRRAYMKSHREKHKDDEAKKERNRLMARLAYRKRQGLPADMPMVKYPTRKYATEEERVVARRLRKRKAYAKRQGLTLEQLDARCAELAKLKEAKAERERLRKAETPEQRRQKQAEAAAKRVREQRLKHGGATNTVMPKARPARKPVNTNDPPELIALFAKASKGQPPVPHNPKVRKISVFHFRGMR